MLFIRRNYINLTKLITLLLVFNLLFAPISFLTKNPVNAQTIGNFDNTELPKIESSIKKPKNPNEEVINKNPKINEAFKKIELTLKWKTDIYSNFTDYIIAKDNTIIAASLNKLLAFNTDGTEKWNFWGHQYRQSPVIGKDNTVYLTDWSRKLHALNPNGSIKWTFDTEHTCRNAPAVADNSLIYVLDVKGVLYAVDSNGMEKGRLSINENTGANVMIGADGIIYFGTSLSHFYSVKGNNAGPADSNRPLFGKNTAHTFSNQHKATLNLEPLTTTPEQ